MYRLKLQLFNRNKAKTWLAGPTDVKIPSQQKKERENRDIKAVKRTRRREKAMAALFYTMRAFNLDED